MSRLYQGKRIGQRMSSVSSAVHDVETPGFADRNGTTSTLPERDWKQRIDSREQRLPVRKEITSVRALPSDNCSNQTLTELCDHIEHTHHAYLRRVLPTLLRLIAKVVASYGDYHRHLLEIYRRYSSLYHELETHMFREEYGLFPDIRRLEQSQVEPFCATGIVRGRILLMKREHRCVDRVLRHIRKLTRAYEVPPLASNDYRAMLLGLCNLETDLRQHMQKEDNILFSKAVALENEVMRV